MSKYVVGVDFGTLSARAVLIDTESGRELAASTFDYPNGVIEGKSADEAYQHPEDYLKALEKTVKGAIQISGVNSSSIVGLCIDFTSCTLLAVDKDGVPLCCLPEYKNDMDSLALLWKDHSAQREADEISDLAKKRNERWLSVYGGRISAEWAFPKMLALKRRSPKIYSSACRFMEAADWLTLVLTGSENRSASLAGYKFMWTNKDGYPSDEFLEELEEGFSGVKKKLGENFFGAGEAVGYINENGAELTGLPKGCVLAAPSPDAHTALAGMGVTDSSELALIVGTSACAIVNADEEREIKGICGYVKNYVTPGKCTYEAGQTAVGDMFSYFVNNCIPAEYTREAEKRNMSIHALLREKASRLKAGESGLIALDWINGNRSPLTTSELSGMIMGITLSTRPEEIYRALIEASAFGMRVIIESFEEGGIKINSISACGGIPLKDEMMMQIYADVFKKRVRIAQSPYASPVGCAAYAAVAAGVYDDINSASETLSVGFLREYTPIEENSAVYDELYMEYKRLFDVFGGDENSVMKKLIKIRASVTQK